LPASHLPVRPALKIQARIFRISRHEINQIKAEYPRIVGIFDVKWSIRVSIIVTGIAAGSEHAIDNVATC
jgi:hypothetical protein